MPWRADQRERVRVLVSVRGSATHYGSGMRAPGGVAAPSLVISQMRILEGIVSLGPTRARSLATARLRPGSLPVRIEVAVLGVGVVAGPPKVVEPAETIVPGVTAEHAQSSVVAVGSEVAVAGVKISVTATGRTLAAVSRNLVGNVVFALELFFFVFRAPIISCAPVAGFLVVLLLLTAPVVFLLLLLALVLLTLGLSLLALGLSPLALAVTLILSSRLG